MSVLRAVTKEETVQYVLAVLVQMLSGEPGGATAAQITHCEWYPPVRDSRRREPGPRQALPPAERAAHRDGAGPVHSVPQVRSCSSWGP